MPHRDDVNVQVSREAKATLDALVDEHLMKRNAFLGAVIHWLSQITRTERALILGQIDHDLEVSVAKLVLKRSRKTGKRT